MAWTTPSSQSTGTLVTASWVNTYLVDNLVYLYSNRRLVQLVNTQTGSNATGTTTIPADATIPQNTEGDEYMTLAITPTSATNKLLIHVVAQLAHSASSQSMSCALFQDTTANALAANVISQATASYITLFSFSHYMTSGTTSSTTFKVRAGSNIAGTTNFNSTTFGGVAASSITISEIKV